MLEITERTKMKEQHDCHDFTVGQRCFTPSALCSVIANKQFTCIFCIKMFAKLINNTKTRAILYRRKLQLSALTL